MTIPLHGLTFGAPLWLWALLAVPALAGLFIWAERRAGQRMRRLIRAPRLRAQLTGAASTARRRWRYGFLLLGLTALLLSLAQPRLGYEQLPAHRQGLDLILLVDVSKSMLATDVLPSRLQRAKLTVQDAVRLLSGDRLGLVAFAGSAFLQAPLTVDYDAVLTATDELDTSLIPRGGTNIGAAINLALEAFGKGEASNRAIILMSDGEPTSDDEQADGVKAAQAAAAAGVKIFTVGFGTADGSLIPVNDSPGEFVRQQDGTLVRTKLNEANLTELAKTAGGFYTPFTNGETTMRAVIQNGLGKVKVGEIDAHDNRKPIERYRWPLGAGLLCLAVSGLIGERRRVRAPAAIGGVSPGARAVPVPRATPGGPVATPATTAVALLLFLFCRVAPVPAQAADESPAPAPVPGSAQGALDLYKKGKYDEAYKAFKQLAEKDPKAGNLQFDTGTSAYKSKQFDEAIQSFGNALASDDPALQAQSQYNFGNTLFRHGQEQKAQDTKLGDWRDAIKHYNDALNYLKTHPDEALAKNTEYNRDVVQKYLDEELKEKKKQDDKKDQKKDDKKDQKKGQDQDKDKGKDKGNDKDKDKGDQQGDGQSGEGSSGQQGSQGKSGSQQQQDQSKGGQGQEGSAPRLSPQESPDSQSPTPQPDQSKGDQGQDASSQPPSDHPTGSPSDGTPDPKSIPNQDKPRPHGEIKTQSGKGDKDKEKGDKAQNGEQGDQGEKSDPAQLAQVEPGKMSAGQARALLDALRDEDDNRVNLNRDHHSRDEQVTKDW